MKWFLLNGLFLVAGLFYLECRVNQIQGKEGLLEAKVTRIHSELTKDIITVGKKYNQIPDLNSDWHVTLFVDTNWKSIPSQVAAVKLWESSPGCIDLRARANGRMLLISDEAAKPYYTHIRATPALMLQDANGKIVYSETNADLGKKPRALMNSITKGVERRRKHCDIDDPRCKPVPVTPDEKLNDKAVDVVDELPTGGVPAPVALGLFLLLGVGTAAAGNLGVFGAKAAKAGR